MMIRLVRKLLLSYGSHTEAKSIKRMVTEQDNQELTIVLGTIKTIKIYQVTEEELEILESGSYDSIHLNFAIALLTSSLSALFIYYTVDNLSLNALALTYSVMLFGFIIGILLIIHWKRSKKNNRDILLKIRERIEANKESMKLKELTKLPQSV